MSKIMKTMHYRRVWEFLSSKTSEQVKSVGKLSERWSMKSKSYDWEADLVSINLSLINFL